MDHDLTQLDAAGLLAAATSSVRDRRLAEVADLKVVAAWAALHAHDPLDDVDPVEARRKKLWGDVLVQVGGEGTPKVQDHCLGEIALARGTGVMSTQNALADVLDLIHRLPLTWAECEAGRCDVYVARRVAKLSRHLSAQAVAVVDAAVAAIIGTQSAGRVLEVAEATIIEADPALHTEGVEAEKRRRYVSASRTDEYGLRTIIARVMAGDAVWVQATLARVADILAPLHPDATPDELRSIGFGYLARPAELLALLVEHRDDDQPDLEPLTEPSEPAEEAEPVEEPSGVLSRAVAFPADLLEALRSTDLSVLAPKAVLYVHLHEAAVHGVDGVARVEGLGPVTIGELAALLARTDLKVQPVIDLADRVTTTAYEHPEALKERVHLITGGDYWPYATSTSRNVDYDHPTPYDHQTAKSTAKDKQKAKNKKAKTKTKHKGMNKAGPPQTGTHNSGPLGRRHHRWKTFAGYRARQCGAGRYVWLTPHGLGFLVDHRGTRPISTAEARFILDAPPGIDIYPE